MPAAITSKDAAKNPGLKTGWSCCGAADSKMHSSSHVFVTENKSSTAMKVISSATPAADTIAPDFARSSSHDANEGKSLPETHNRFR